MGGKRQIHELLEICAKVYLAAGVLVDDPECRNDPAWGLVRPDQAAARCRRRHAAGRAGSAARQALAARRSRRVGLADLYRRIEAELLTVPPKDIRRSILEGINFRLKPLVQGEAGLQYCAGSDASDINDVVPGAWGVAVLEGGAFLDDFSKAFLLGWAAWQLYTDAVVLRARGGAGRPAHMQIVFEEANKILAGLDNARAGEDEGGGLSTADQFANMWRDSRKYGIWLHLITQSPALIPPGILASCNNLFVAHRTPGTTTPRSRLSPVGEGFRGRAVAALWRRSRSPVWWSAGLPDRRPPGAVLHPAAAAPAQASGADIAAVLGAGFVILDLRFALRIGAIAFRSRISMTQQQSAIENRPSAITLRWDLLALAVVVALALGLLAAVADRGFSRPGGWPSRRCRRCRRLRRRPPAGGRPYRSRPLRRCPACPGCPR